MSDPGVSPSYPQAPRPVETTKTVEFEVIAMYDYPGLEKGDLPLCKGQRVVIFDDSREYWWRARNNNG